MYADMSDALYRGGGGGKEEEADGSNKNRQGAVKYFSWKRLLHSAAWKKAESLSSLLPQYVFSAIISLSLSLRRPLAF